MRLPARVALGTMHGKAAAIAPPLSKLGIVLSVPEALDTDRFGAFSGEPPRTLAMIDATHAGAHAAVAATGLPVALASESAYGPHPVIPFLPRGWRSQSGTISAQAMRSSRPLQTTIPGRAHCGIPLAASVVLP